MKTFLWVLVLGLAAFFLYRRAHDYGWPWEQQVVMSGYEHSRRYSGGADHMYVYGEIENRTRKRVRAEVECMALPAGMTLTAKASTAVALQPLQRAPFDLTLTHRANATGAECRVGKYDVEGGLEEKFAAAVRGVYERIRRLF